MSATPERHVFISFSSKDDKQARAACAEMERRGLKCWISSRDVRPGRNYQTEIIEAIRCATHLLLIFSANANRSPEVPRELSLASKAGVTIVPLRIQNILPTEALEYALATSQWVDAFDDWQGAMERLATGLGASGEPQTGERANRATGKKPPIAIIAGGAAAVIAITGIGIYLATKPGPPAETPKAAEQTVQPVPSQPVLGPAGSHPVAPAPAARTAGQPGQAAPDTKLALAAVEKLANGLECAHVSVWSDGRNGFALSGFVRSAEDEQRLLAAAPGVALQNEIDVAPWPFCEVRGLGPTLGAADDLAITINHPDGRYAIGDELTGSFVASGQGKVWVQVDLIQFDGAVFHVLPLPGRVRVVKGGDEVRIGGPKGDPNAIQATDPPGALILLVVASSRPLPAPARTNEAAQDYLPKLRQALAALGGTLSISTQKITVTRNQL